MLKRPFLSVAIAFAAGILSFAYGINIFLLLTVSLLLTALVYFFGEKHRYLLFTLITVFLLGILAMNVTTYNKEKVIRRFEGKEKAVNLTVTEFSSDGKVIAEFKDNAKTYKVYLVTENKAELSPGDIIKTIVKFKRPYTSKVSISDFSTYLASKRVYLYGYASETQVIGKHKSGIMGFVYSARRYVDKIGKDAFSGDIRALFNAMVLGDKRLMTAELSASLKASGLNHIAVVSGMHLSVMISVLMMLFGSLVGVGRRAKILISIGAVAVTLLTGAGLSVIRACVMCVVCQGAFLTRRENDSLSGLSVTVFVMLLFNPFVIFDIGFVLSVLAVLGILLFNDPVRAIVSKRIKGKTGETISVSIAAQLIIVPALIKFFGTISTYSVPANLLVTVFASLIVVAGMAFTVVSQIPLISVVTEFIIEVCCETVIRLCKLIEKFPGTITDTVGIGWDFFIIWTFFLVIFGLKKKNLKFIPVISLCFAIALGGAFVYYCDNKSKIKMDFVPYGKEVMTAVACPDGPFLLLRCPDYGDASVLAESYGRRSYTYTVITVKKDLSDVEALASRNESGTVIVLSEAFSLDEKQELYDSLQSHGTDVIFLKNKEIFSEGDFSVRFHTFCISDNVIAATDMEYKGKTFISLQDFDAFGLEELVKRKYLFQCDYLFLPENLPENIESYENLTSGSIVTDKNKFTINLY